jgi:hypothetical protein
MTAETVRPEDLSADDRLLYELLRGARPSDAAAAAGLNERTARRHRAAAEFRAREAEGRRQLDQLIFSHAAVLSLRALDTLADLLDLEDAPAQRLGASREILRGYVIAGERVETADLAERLGRIEHRLGLTVVDEDAA